MLLYSGKNAVVHTCNTFHMCLLWLVGEETNVKMRVKWTKVKYGMAEPIEGPFATPNFNFHNAVVYLRIFSRKKC